MGDWERKVGRWVVQGALTALSIDEISARANILETKCIYVDTTCAAVFIDDASTHRLRSDK